MEGETRTAGADGTDPAELERLRRENAELKARVGPVESSRSRGFFSWVLVVLMCVATFGAVLTVWVHYTTLNTSRFVNVVGPLVKEPAVDKALSRQVVDRLFVTYDLAKQIEKQLNTKLPDLLKGVAEPASSGARGLAEALTNDALRSEAFQTVWRNILAAAHSEAVKGIRASGSININQQGEVVLDISNLLKVVKDKLASVGLGFLKSVDIPSDLGQVVLYKNAQLGNAKKAVQLLDTLFWVLPWVAAFLLICAVLLAVDRRRALIGSAVGIILVTLALLGVLKGFESHYIGMINNVTNRTAAMVVASHVEGGLYLVVLGLVLLSVLTLVAAVVAGPYGWSLALHQKISRSGRKTRRAGSQGAEGTSVDKFAWPLRLLGLAAAVLLMLYLPWANVAVVVVLCVCYAGYLVAVELLR